MSTFSRGIEFDSAVSQSLAGSATYTVPAGLFFEGQLTGTINTNQIVVDGGAGLAFSSTQGLVSLKLGPGSTILNNGPSTIRLSGFLKANIS